MTSASLAEAASTTRNVERLVCVVIAVAIFAVVLARAWVGDDALITVRTLDNLMHGYGLRWNVDERVQAFTHPLWAFLLLPLLWLMRWYEALIVLSMLATLGTLLLIVCRARSHAAAIAGLCVIGCSR